LKQKVQLLLGRSILYDRFPAQLDGKIVRGGEGEGEGEGDINICIYICIYV
jgi:hypothetical protein